MFLYMCMWRPFTATLVYRWQKWEISFVGDLRGVTRKKKGKRDNENGFQTLKEERIIQILNTFRTILLAQR